MDDVAMNCGSILPEISSSKLCNLSGQRVEWLGPRDSAKPAQDPPTSKCWICFREALLAAEAWQARINRHAGADGGDKYVGLGNQLGVWAMESGAGGALRLWNDENHYCPVKCRTNSIG